MNHFSDPEGVRICFSVCTYVCMLESICHVHTYIRMCIFGVVAYAFGNFCMYCTYSAYV